MRKGSLPVILAVMLLVSGCGPSGNPTDGVSGSETVSRQGEDAGQDTAPADGQQDEETADENQGTETADGRQDMEDLEEQQSMENTEERQDTETGVNRQDHTADERETADTGDSSGMTSARLPENYHNELVNDLIPAVEGTYSMYAEDTTPEGIRQSRDHRAFCGFSMGSVATWRTFQYCLDEFRYFMPSSGSLTTDGEYMSSLVRDSGHVWNDFFVFAASGTDDFAYSSFKAQIEAMAETDDGTFRFADNEKEGNLYFLEQEGGTHSGEYAMEYFYNGLCWIWQ